MNEEEYLEYRLEKLYNAIKGEKTIDRKNSLLSNDIYRYLYNHDAFPENEYNYYNGEVDMEFLAEMRIKKKTSIKQDRKFDYLFKNVVAPFLIEKFEVGMP